MVVAPPWFEVPPARYGGIERMCFDLVEGLVDEGHEVTLVATGSNHTRAQFVPALPQPARGLGRIEQPVEEVRYGAVVARLARESSVDVIHDHSLAGPLGGADGRLRVVVTVHGPPGGSIGDYYRHLGLPLVAISEAQRRAAPDLPWVATVANSVRVDQYPFREAKEGFVLFLGRFAPEKGVHLAIEAARAAGVPLVLAGKCIEPDERAYFEREIRPRLHPGVTWLGEVSEDRKKDLLGAARCLLFPILWEEPFGIVMIEALASGTPVVAFGRGAVPEIVQHGRTGFVCDDVREMAGLIHSVSQLDTRACRLEAVRRFDTSAMVRGYERAYRTVVTSRRRGRRSLEPSV